MNNTNEISGLFKTALSGLVIDTPIVSGSGTFGFGLEFPRIEGFNIEDYGAICLKGTTLEPRIGNPPPRVVETYAGMLNAIGLQNPGVEMVIKDYLPKARKLKTKLIANISGKTVDEYAQVAEKFTESGMIDAIEINVSCPNVKQGGITFGTLPNLTESVVRQVRAVTPLPLITKLTPNVTNIGEIADAAIQGGSDILSCINTIGGMMIDIYQKKPMIANNMGGVSGPAIMPIAILKTWQVYQVAQKSKTPIIGQGGISNGRDAVQFLLAGANAISIGTALFTNPFLAGEILLFLQKYCQEQGIYSLKQLVGQLELH